MEDGLAGAVKGAIELLDTKTIKPGEYDCICTPEVTGMIAHEAFGHGAWRWICSIKTGHLP